MLGVPSMLRVGCEWGARRGPRVFIITPHSHGRFDTAGPRVISGAHTAGKRGRSSCARRGVRFFTRNFLGWTAGDTGTGRGPCREATRYGGKYGSGAVGAAELAVAQAAERVRGCPPTPQPACGRPRHPATPPSQSKIILGARGVVSRSVGRPRTTEWCGRHTRTTQ